MRDAVRRHNTPGMAPAPPGEDAFLNHMRGIVEEAYRTFPGASMFRIENVRIDSLPRGYDSMQRRPARAADCQC